MIDNQPYVSYDQIRDTYRYRHPEEISNNRESIQFDRLFTMQEPS